MDGPVNCPPKQFICICEHVLPASFWSTNISYSGLTTCDTRGCRRLACSNALIERWTSAPICLKTEPKLIVPLTKENVEHEKFCKKAVRMSMILLRCYLLAEGHRSIREAKQRHQSAVLFNGLAGKECLSCVHSSSLTCIVP